MTLVTLKRILLVAGAWLLLGGCASTPNPSLPVTTQQAYRALGEMAAEPRPAPRPVVVVGGYADPGLVADSVRSRLAACLGDTPMVKYAPGSAQGFSQARRELVEAVQQAWPSADAAYTVEVDVVCVSMGGLVAIHAADAKAASANAGMRTLRAARIFTVASPLRGADAAKYFGIGSLVQDMRAGSPFLVRIDEVCDEGVFELYPYTRTDDTMVGAANTAPPGQWPWWVPGEFGQSDHLTVHQDPRIIGDIARRLRGEQPWSREPRAALPKESG